MTLILAVLVAAMVALPVAFAAEGDARFDNLIKVRTNGGVVVSESAQASQAGLNVLNDGGNAIDAAIATTFAIGVTRPDNCGIGGGGHLVYRAADGSTAALDFRESAPQAMDENTFNRAADGGSTSDEKPGIHKEGSGHTVVGVPGVVAGMDEALTKLGSGNYTLGQLIAPAEGLARDGVKVTWGLQLAVFLHETRFVNYPETARLYGGGTAHGPFVYRPAGAEDPTVFKQEDYGKSLRQIMDHGAEAFYEAHDYPVAGPLGGTTPSIGKLLVQDMATAEENGKLNPVLQAKTNGQPNDVGLIEKDDLEDYAPKWRTPLVGHYRDHAIIAMPPPAAGLVTIEILNLLENFKVSSFGHSSADHLHALAEAQKLAWADRNAYLADPDKVSVPTDVLTSKGYAQQRASEIEMDDAKSVEEYGKGTTSPPYEGSHTTHISVIDEEGNAVAVTCSLGDQFGSAVVAPGTGFLLNNQLRDFDETWAPDAAVPANAPAGGKKPRSAQSPTIVAKGGRAILVTGGAGGPTIILGVVQNIVNVVDFGLDVFHTMNSPRIDAANAPFVWSASDQSEDECTNDQLALEHNRIADAVETQLIGRTHSLCFVDSSDGYFNTPIVQSAGTDPATDELLAVSDPRGFDLDVFGVDELDFYDDQGPMGQ